ncbi:hypothetical protein [Enterovirga rhinocerotis]|uniref:MORN repeat protein n=1 Tax=Enterovirga rhinocerotis TaxID=1339210 RepID=A0A4R7CBV3_9HYPH|nr:hypothetical protein [Enterovirga rhinocerotis]TDR94596.1 hypothetical protein EV668_1884 [Enterovirga rhinocerotis]
MLTRGFGGALILGLALSPQPAAAQATEAQPPAEASLPLVQVAIRLPTEAGRWETRSQPIYDAHRQALSRRTYTVWNARPSLGLDFVWIPDREAAARPGRVSGQGRLVWRLAGKPSYDPSAFFAEYQGAMRDGRPEGHGMYRDRTGLTYEGPWLGGLPHGEGRLKLGNGAEFAGLFRRGAAEGPGHFYDVDGEIFEGRFRQGLRNGQGRTVLPNGAAYRSDWAAGEEQVNSRRIRLAQLGPARGPGEDIRLGISVDRQDDDSLLQYSATNAESGLVIQPSKRRLMALWKGNENIQLTMREENPSERGSYGVFAYASGDLPPLTLVFEVQNRASAPVRIRGAHLDVESSVSDLQPAIQLSSGATAECGARNRPDFSPRFELENFGWSPAERAQLRFAFARPKTSVAPSAFGVTKEIGLIRTAAKIDMEPELRAAGVKTDQLKRRADTGGIGCRSRGNGPACLAEIAASGLFGTLSRQITLEERDIYLNAVGNLSYVWKNAKGEEEARTSPFTARLLLGRTPIEAECGEGAEKEPVGKKPLEFRLDQSRYRLPIAFERTIPAGRSARYTVAVSAAKSSGHNFKVVLQTADGQQIASRPISLTYFRPSRLVEGTPTE